MRIGILSDTHGYLDPRALPQLQGVAHILHAGDIGSPAIITALEAIAPVSAVHGNTDTGELVRRYPASQQLTLAGVNIYLTHIGGKPEALVRCLPEPRPQVFVFGHTHVALLETHDGVLFLNPGAAGRPRFGGGLSVALLEIEEGRATARIVRL
ncbi:MAG: metallophosphatase family protein [Chloroflexaceae bacterium]|jgi:hypothetical protein|nr:metallophosphatase family protein [Chloroflexaceae bacterium]